MTDISTHTPTPWSIHSMGENDEPRVVHEGGWKFNQRYIGSGSTIVADVNWNDNPRGGYPSASSNEEMLANARFIVKAVNSHEPYEAALEAVEYQLGGETDAVKKRFADVRKTIRQALATARGTV